MMRKISRYASVFCFYSAVVSGVAFGLTPDSHVILPGQGIGNLRGGMTKDEIVKVLSGPELGEGEDGGKPSLSAYFMDPKRRIALRLDAQGKVCAMTLHGVQSTWHFPHGLSLGTSLKTLQKENGKPFKVHAFDNSPEAGRIVDWGGGALEKAMPKVTLTFASPMHAAGYKKLSGSQKEAIEKPADLLSSGKELQLLDPVLETIELTF